MVSTYVVNAILAYVMNVVVRMIIVGIQNVVDAAQKVRVSYTVTFVSIAARHMYVECVIGIYTNRKIDHFFL
jgi:hypothetical protein